MVVTKYIRVQTDSTNDDNHVCIIDITPQVGQLLKETGVSNGTVTLFIAGSTAGLTTIEYEPGLISDIKAMWERNVPRHISYEHDRRWGDGNGYSHVRASLLGASLSIPFSEGKLLLGTWQQLVVVDFDNRPRNRDIVMQVMGE